MKITYTDDIALNGVNFCIYGEAGMGKTTLCKTAPNPIIISAEAGLLSLADEKLPVIVVNTMKECLDAYKWLSQSQEANQYTTVCIDSLSEIAEVLLTEEKKKTKDPRQAYGVMADDMAILIRNFRDLTSKHVYFSCKLKKEVDEVTKAVTYKPGVPGQLLLQSLPFFFDELFVMRMGKLADGSYYRYLQTDNDLQYIAKDRSGKLAKITQPDIGYIINKIQGE
ncbi:MAG: AAA family ATPase [Chloroflexi bacterium]|nr:MAG: AAA family ATPase [Chloroflexota bacterium]